MSKEGLVGGAGRGVPLLPLLWIALGVALLASLAFGSPHHRLLESVTAAYLFAEGTLAFVARSLDAAGDLSVGGAKPSRLALCAVLFLARWMLMLAMLLGVALIVIRG